MVNIRVNYVFSDVLSSGHAGLRTNLLTAEPLIGGHPNVRVNWVFAEPMIGGHPLMRVNMIIVEAFCPVDPEERMSTIPFPGFGNSESDPSVPAGLNPFSSALPGLAFSVHKKPMFNTRISEGASGFEVRNALMEFPKWEFNLTYEFLEDASGAESSLKTIQGFFLARQGAFDSWLFKDPDDYLCVGSTCGYPDGVTTTFNFCREMTGGFRERVGQVDTANTITLYLTVEEATTIPALPGPYTVTVAQAASFTEDLGVTKGGVPMTKVTSGLGAGEYMVDELTGIYTFDATDESDAIVISYRYEVNPADYTITLPNSIIFDTAPAEGTLTGDFQFYFVCRFLEDQMDFEKFADKLWNLQQCDFRSLIL